jgi:quinol monooxygenase YgiN
MISTLSARPPAASCKERPDFSKIEEITGGEEMVKYALYGMLKAKPGKEADLEAFLKQGAEMAKKESGTVTWYAIKEDDGRYGIFDTFNDEAGREAHLNGEIAKALMAKASELLAEPPQIHKIAVLATK